jgi:hypothetical protein
MGKSDWNFGVKILLQAIDPLSFVDIVVYSDNLTRLIANTEKNISAAGISESSECFCVIGQVR